MFKSRYFRVNYLATRYLANEYVTSFLGGTLLLALHGTGGATEESLVVYPTVTLPISSVGGSSHKKSKQTKIHLVELYKQDVIKENQYQHLQEDEEIIELVYALFVSKLI